MTVSLFTLFFLTRSKSVEQQQLAWILFNREDHHTH